MRTNTNAFVGAVLVIIFAWISFISTAQDQKLRTFHHVIRYKKLSHGDYILLFRIDSNSMKVPYNLASKKLKAILTQKDGEIRVDFLPITFQPASITSATGVVNTSVNLSAGHFILQTPTRITLSVQNSPISVRFRSWAAGIGINTFRYRPGQDSVNANVASNLSFSATYGRVVGFSRMTAERRVDYSVTWAGFAGFTSADLKRTTVSEPSKWIFTDRINPALSYGASAIFSRNNIGLIFAMGFDCNIGPHANMWAYQNKPWFGFGLSTSLNFL